jgi:hypothetical protein
MRSIETAKELQNLSIFDPKGPLGAVLMQSIETAKERKYPKISDLRILSFSPAAY